MTGLFDDLVPGSGNIDGLTKTAMVMSTNDLAAPPGGYRGPGIAASSVPPYALPNASALSAYSPPGASTGSGGTPTPSPSPTPTPAPAPAPAPAPGTGTPATGSALDPWNTFYNSPAYQVPLQEGLKGVNTHYAAIGALESGAAMKAINDYAAGHAASALNTYMDDLYRQEALGESAAAATAGVGEGLVNQVSANNNNAAAAAGNAALVGGQAASNNWNNVGSAIGTGAGQIAGALSSSYAPTVPTLNIPAFGTGINGGGMYG
jgi:hypothetical protein